MLRRFRTGIREGRLGRSGVSRLALLLIVVGIGLAGLAAWRVWRSTGPEPAADSRSAADETPRTRTYTDSAHVYSLRYPGDWRLEKSSPGGEGPMPDYTKVSRTVTIAVPDKKIPAWATVQADRTGKLKKDIEANWADNHHQPQAKKINGYDAEYVRVDFKGDAQKYVDHNYLITDGQSSVFIAFTESMDHPMSNNVWDARQYLPGLLSIVNSVKFLPASAASSGPETLPH